jgi:hypothetical protein
MKNYNKKIKMIILFMIVIQHFSCNKFVEVKPPNNIAVTSTVFDNDATATSAVLGMYIYMMRNPTFTLTNGGITVSTGLSSDELYPYQQKRDDVGFYNNAISPTTNTINTGFWTAGYSLIFQANACIEGLSGSNGVSRSVKNQLLGEAKFIRAFLYLNLANLFGPIPLATTTQYKINGTMARTSLDSIYNLINADLLGAKNLLAPAYVAAAKLRPNKYAATALLARAYLYEKKWDSAEAVSTEIINSGAYSLDSNLNDVFLANSSEAIWQISPVLPGWEVTEAFNFIPMPIRYTLTNDLLHAFETGDKRFSSWTDSVTSGGNAYYYPNKYKLSYDGNTSPLEDYMVLRLAELYLIRAEARAEQNKITDAQIDLNIIRARAGLDPTTATDQGSLLTAILHERQVELFAEWGHRWYDLKRTGTADSVLTIAKPGRWKATGALFPIPFAQLKINPFLTQNTGY